VTDVITTTDAQLSHHHLNSPDAVQLHSGNVVSYSEEVAAMTRPLKNFLYQRMYRHYRVMRMQAKAERFISELFNAYVKEPRMLPTKTQERLADLPVERVVVDYLAGMTDRYALDEWERLFNPYQRA
ncbi:MAG: deoxyguanosinetriphosphate triphosphohydrolase, partial [Chloroflexota bacterium]